MQDYIGWRSRVHKCWTFEAEILYYPVTDAIFERISVMPFRLCVPLSILNDEINKTQRSFDHQSITESATGIPCMQMRSLCAMTYCKNESSNILEVNWSGSSGSGSEGSSEPVSELFERRDVEHSVC